MNPRPIVLAHAYKHGLNKRDILHAWTHVLASRERLDLEVRLLVVVGLDSGMRPLQIIATQDACSGEWSVFHAMRATKKVMREVGLIR